MRLPSSLATLVALALAHPAAFAIGASDDFERPNGTNMGPDWLEIDGNTAIENGMGKGSSGAFNLGWMHHASFVGAFQDSVQSVDFQVTSTGQAIVLLSGVNPNTWGGISVKIQDNDGDSLLDRLFFEQAFNAGSWGAGAPIFFDLAAPTASGRMTVHFANGGDTVVCDIQNDASGLTESYSASGITSFAFPIDGTNFGIGHRGAVLFDNWQVDIDVASYGAGCPGSGGFVPVLSTPSNPTAGQSITINVADGVGGAPCLFLFGLTKAQVPFGYGGCELLLGSVLAPTITVPLGGVGPGNGVVTLTGTLPVNTSGVTATMQAFVGDAGAPDGFTATNGLELVIL